MADAMPASLVLVGAGKMGSAMLEGWIAAGLDGEAVTIVDPNPSRDTLSYARAHKISLNPALRDIEPPQVLVLAIKPQALDTVAPALTRMLGQGTVVLSILAGKTIAELKAKLKGAHGVIRAMPNLPVSVARGVTVAVASPEVFPYHRAIVHNMLNALGTAEWLEDESLIDAVTAVSGSGPAYLFYLTECLSRAAQAAGMPIDLAERLAKVTVAGAAELMYRSDLPPSKLRQNVTSPGGTTAAALEVLGGATGLTGMDRLMRDAVAAAKRRAQELGS